MAGGEQHKKACASDSTRVSQVSSNLSCIVALPFSLLLSPVKAGEASTLYYFILVQHSYCLNFPAATSPPKMRTIFLSSLVYLFAGLALVSAVPDVGEVKNAGAGGYDGRKLGRKERMELAKEEAKKYMELRRQGVDEVSHTKEAAAMRDYQLRKKKRKGLLGRRQGDLASILFPGVSPENYMPNEPIFAITDYVHSKKTQLPFEFYDLPGCPKPEGKSWMKSLKQRRNLGVRLQGNELMPAPFPIRVTQNQSCKPLCKVSIGSKKVRWMRKLVERQYRIQMSLDQLPVLMRSKELNYAVRGYPVGFKAPPSYTGLEEDEYYLYNHVKFTISYQEDPSAFEGVRITGFDVHPVSIKHDTSGISGEVLATSEVSTCNGDGVTAVENNPSTYLRLRLGATGENLDVIYSYEVEWQSSDLPWADRWDVYLIGSPDDDIHFFAIVNSLMIVLFLTGAIATIMIRTLRQDIAGYNEIQTLEGKWAILFCPCSAGILNLVPSLNPYKFSQQKRPKKKQDGSWFMEMFSALQPSFPWRCA